MSNSSAAYLPSDERVSSHWLEPTDSERLSAREIVSARVSGSICLGTLSRFAFFFFEFFSFRQNKFFGDFFVPIGFSGFDNIPWIGASQYHPSCPRPSGPTLSLGLVIHFPCSSHFVSLFKRKIMFFTFAFSMFLIFFSSHFAV